MNFPSQPDDHICEPGLKLKARNLGATAAENMSHDDMNMAMHVIIAQIWVGFHQFKADEADRRDREGRGE